MKVNGKNAGMMVAYNWTTRNQQLAKSFLLILRHMKIKFFLRIRPLWWSDDLSKFDENTFYISNLAFFPEFRNQGLGTRLLSHTQEVARKSQAKRLDVDVETYNEGALRFYKRFGMKAAGETKKIEIDGKRFEFIRLTKEIPLPP